MKKVKRPCVTAWKGSMGHLTAGAGALETMFFIQAMNHNEFPQIKNLKTPCEPALNYAMGSNTKMEADIIVKSGLGLGINCAALVLKRYKE